MAQTDAASSVLQGSVGRVLTALEVAYEPELVLEEVPTPRGPAYP